MGFKSDFYQVVDLIPKLHWQANYVKAIIISVILIKSLAALGTVVFQLMQIINFKMSKLD